MKTLSDAAFFRLFDTLADAGNPGSKLNLWNFAGAEWRRERFSISSADYSFVVETFTIRLEARPRWALLVAKEHWWAGCGREALRSVRWSRPLAGRRSDEIAWFRKQESAMEESVSARAR